jgi:hypothetical protein
MRVRERSCLDGATKPHFDPKLTLLHTAETGKMPGRAAA